DLRGLWQELCFWRVSYPSLFASHPDSRDVGGTAHHTSSTPEVDRQRAYARPHADQCAFANSHAAHPPPAQPRTSAREPLVLSMGGRLERCSPYDPLVRAFLLLGPSSATLSEYRFRQDVNSRIQAAAWRGRAPNPWSDRPYLLWPNYNVSEGSATIQCNAR